METQEMEGVCPTFVMVQLREKAGPASGEPEQGLRILTNLAEMKLEDAALLRVLAWRMEQAGDLDRAPVLFRKAGKLRPEEPQSLRDLALALTERGKAQHATGDLTEAMGLLHKMIFGEWQRFDEIEVIGLEELNALIAWTKSQQWTRSPAIPDLDSRLTQNLDCDVRIVLSWDADNTDVDLHVMEPGGEEAFYGHNRTSIGGLVSRDFTQGYGPEEYLLHGAKPGVYKLFAHYFGSHQQTITGAATVAARSSQTLAAPRRKSRCSRSGSTARRKKPTWGRSKSAATPHPQRSKEGLSLRSCSSPCRQVNPRAKSSPR